MTNPLNLNAPVDTLAMEFTHLRMAAVSISATVHIRRLTSSREVHSATSCSTHGAT